MIDYFTERIYVVCIGGMEEDLYTIEEVKSEWVNVNDDFYQDFQKRLEVAEEEMEKIEIKDEPAGIDCENCGHGMVYKMGRYGKFLACSNFQECRNTKPILIEIGIQCPH